MNFPSTDVIQLVSYLVPGFISAWLFHVLSAYEKGNQFERIVQAIILSFVISTLVEGIEAAATFIGNFIAIGHWSIFSENMWRVIIAISLGFSLAYMSNRNLIMPTLQKLRITGRTTHPSLWHQALSEHQNWLILHLIDGRRLSGYPRLWPSSCKEGHFQILEPIWLEGEKENRLTGCGSILIPSSEVLWVELMEEWNGKTTE